MLRKCSQFSSRAVNPPTAQNIGSLLVDGEQLHVPARVYFHEPDENRISRLSPEQRLVLACIFSHHHDGHLREKYLRGMMQADVAWIAPYVVQMVGEYVIEILQAIEENIDVLDGRLYRAFVAENPAFLELTRARVISYWNEYYRRRIRKFEDYVGHRLLRALRVIDGGVRQSSSGV